MNRALVLVTALSLMLSTPLPTLAADPLSTRPVIRREISAPPMATSLQRQRSRPTQPSSAGMSSWRSAAARCSGASPTEP